MMTLHKTWQEQRHGLVHLSDIKKCFDWSFPRCHNFDHQKASSIVLSGQKLFHSQLFLLFIVTSVQTSIKIKIQITAQISPSFLFLKKSFKLWNCFKVTISGARYKIKWMQCHGTTGIKQPSREFDNNI